ncbi:MAG: hypothetical protein HN494_03685 [Opitutae bacterium]|nr:hypothetical protein [Opitutae bacterium]MBT4667886.1 hypothetical protein [Opitutae bacterium]MBT5908884.1 hypothetical protein [Opitutae bacterium]MBT6851325.1 hypothetical protein [Opitutae bacterium]MBT7743635.1 hypothetical protein [Opitutae bacterium]
MTAKQILLKAAALMGRKGGRAGTGKTKRRGNANYYRDMQKKSVEVRIKNKNPDKT